MNTLNRMFYLYNNRDNPPRAMALMSTLPLCEGCEEPRFVVKVFPLLCTSSYLRWKLFRPFSLSDPPFSIRPLFIVSTHVKLVVLPLCHAHVGKEVRRGKWYVSNLNSFWIKQGWYELTSTNTCGMHYTQPSFFSPSLCRVMIKSFTVHTSSAISTKKNSHNDHNH